MKIDKLKQIAEAIDVYGDTPLVYKGCLKLVERVKVLSEALEAIRINGCNADSIDGECSCCIARETLAESGFDVPLKLSL